MTRPIILVVAHRRQVETPFGLLPSCVVYEAYLERLQAAGAVPLIAWPRCDDPERLLAGADGVVLVGGGDVAPERFGSNEAGELVDRARDRFEEALVHGSRERGTPFLGVCRGSQMLNVALGGTLARVVGHPRREDLARHVHEVQVEPGTRLAAISGPDRLGVNSFHRWAADRVGAGLRVAARHPQGAIEAIESEDAGWFALGVQWHPESLDSEVSERLFATLVEAAGEARP